MKRDPSFSALLYEGPGAEALLIVTDTDPDVLNEAIEELVEDGATLLWRGLHCFTYQPVFWRPQ